MKVELKEPIQSLLAFGRHVSRGGNAALPLLTFRNFRSLLLPVVIGLAASSAIAQQKNIDRQSSDSNEKRIDLLFDQIMNTLPNNERLKVDSAASITTNRPSPTSNTSSLPHDHTVKTLRATRVDELPPELKAQVERTINSMELRKEERKAQFREIARERH